jgi:two-component system sensor kinase FixL
MMNDGSAITPSVGSKSRGGRGHGANRGRQTPTAASDRLVRTMDGRITAWSPGMQRRYGFTSEEAHGCTSHQLLRTIFPQALKTIEATLAQRNAWSGGLIHHRADGTAVMAISHWYVYRDVDAEACLVAEVHADIPQDGSVARHELADVFAALAHELSEKLLAMRTEIDAAQQCLQAGWPDLNSVREAIARASTQIALSAQGVRLLGELSNSMREAA